MKTWMVPTQACSACTPGLESVRQVAINGKTPTCGDCGVCSGCGAVLRFGADGEPVQPLSDEQTAALPEPSRAELLNLRRAVRAVHEIASQR